MKHALDPIFRAVARVFAAVDDSLDVWDPLASDDDSSWPEACR